MIINSKSLCDTCIYTIDCSLTTNKNAIWSCSEYEKKSLKNTNPKPILTPNFSFTESENEFETI